MSTSVRTIIDGPLDLAAQPKGSGQPVVLLPGYGAGDASTALLRPYLRYLGYDACGWGLGTNTGDVPALIPKAAQLVAEIAAETRQPVRLIGWSLGGHLAREAARERPAAVSRVITLGSPVIGGPKYTAVADVYRRQGYDLDAIASSLSASTRAGHGEALRPAPLPHGASQQTLGRAAGRRRTSREGRASQWGQTPPSGESSCGRRPGG